jgi:chromosome segregation ATPase
MAQIENLREFKQKHENDISALKQKALEASEEISALNLILEERDSELMAEQEFSRGKEAEIAGHRSQIDLLKSGVERDVDIVASNAALESRVEQQRVDALDSAGIIADLEKNVADLDEEINSLRCDSIAKEKTVLVMEGRIEQLEQGMQDQLIDHKNECDSLIAQVKEVKGELVKVCLG